MPPPRPVPSLHLAPHHPIRADFRSNLSKLSRQSNRRLVIPRTARWNMNAACRIKDSLSSPFMPLSCNSSLLVSPYLRFTLPSRPVPSPATTCHLGSFVRQLGTSYLTRICPAVLLENIYSSIRLCICPCVARVITDPSFIPSVSPRSNLGQRGAKRAE